MAKLKVRYSCHLCGIYRVECEVDERGPEDVSDWMKQTVKQVRRHHLGQVGTCTATKLDELLIPTAGANRVGEIARS